MVLWLLLAVVVVVVMTLTTGDDVEEPEEWDLVVLVWYPSVA